MKEYIMIGIVGVVMIVLFILLNKYKTPKYRFLSSIVGIVAFTAFFILDKVVAKKAVTDDLVSLFLFIALIIFLAGHAFKSYKQLHSK